MPQETAVNTTWATPKLCVDYAHVGLLDTSSGKMWIARKRLGSNPSRISHARLLQGGTQDTSTGQKDRYMCFWFNTPGSGSGFVHGYPIEWSEGHLLVRLDPSWDYARRELVAPGDAAAVERNTEQQYAWARGIFQAYAALKRTFPLSWHLVGPRAADSMFYVERVEANA